MLLMGVPLLLLPMAARGFRPRGIAVACLAAVFMWQALPAVAGWRTATESRAADETFWYPVIGWLAEHPDPDHRVQVVATADNWEAFHLARRGVPLARGWFRQDDFPANAVLYGELTRRTYDTWLRRTGVRYVFLPDEPLDYSAANEATLLRSGYSGLRPGGPGRRVDGVRAPRSDADRHTGRRDLRDLADLQGRHPAGGAPGHLPAEAALHALLAGGDRVGLRHAPRALGYRSAGARRPGSCVSRSTCAWAPSSARCWAARAAAARPCSARACPAPSRRSISGIRAVPRGGPTAGRRATSRGRSGSR